MSFFDKWFGSRGEPSSLSSTDSKATNRPADDGGESKQGSAMTGPANWNKLGISELPADFLQKAESLKRIDLSENALQVLGVDFTVFSASLQELDVNDNKLKTLPASVGSLRNLQILHAHKNELEDSPAEIGNLAALREFNVFNNKLTESPEGIGMLGSLQLLNAASNQVKPGELEQAPHTRVLIEHNAVGSQAAA
jgi:Leucine-rich repeat (LRR) protein